VDDLWATKSEGVGLIVRAISYQVFQPMWSWITNVTVLSNKWWWRTDRRTDDTRSQDRALHYSASRGNKGLFKPQGHRQYAGL